MKGISTKGTVVTTANIATEYGSFVTDVWVADEHVAAVAAHEQPAHYIVRETVSYDEHRSPYKWEMSSERYWLNDVGMCFWSWAPVEVGTRSIGVSSNLNAGNCTLAFSYSLPVPDGVSDAAEQKDLLFAFNREHHTDSSSDVIDINFYHALACIRFMVDTEDGTFNNDLEIANIRIQNIYSHADCMFRPYEADSGDKFAWSGLDVKTTVGQNCTIAGDFTEHPKPGYSVMSSRKAFLLIPQTTPAGADLVITFRRSDDSLVERAVHFAGEEWTAGHYYTYKIHATSFDDVIEIQCIVHDWLEDDEFLLR